jgi:hypothetical protein
MKEISAAASLSLDNGFIWAIHQVETGGFLGSLYGANGEIGPFQITRPFWIDSKIEGEYEQCLGYDYSVRVITGYFNRYGREYIINKDYESLARLFNSGPNWKNKINLTNNYWHKVKDKLYEYQKRKP